MIFDGFLQAVGRLLATDGALMILSMLFGVLVGMLWTGRSFPRRLPRAIVRGGGLRR